MIKKYLDDLESRIDPEIEDDLISQWKSFADGNIKEGLFSPARPYKSPPTIEWPKVLVNKTLENFDLMALQQFYGCSEVLAGGTGALMNVRSNYGTSIIPSLFGAELFIMDKDMDTLPTSRPLSGGSNIIKSLIKQSVPDLNCSLGGRTLEMGRLFVKLVKDYPKIKKYVHLYHPDLQGPMDICEVLWGSSLFLDIVDKPDLVKEFLSLVTETYIQFMQAWMQIIPFSKDYAVHWSLLLKGNIMLRDDSAMNFSPEMFEKVIEPYDQKLLDEFGGGGIHFCGRGDHYIHRLSVMKGVYAVAMSQPEYNNMEIIFKNTVDKDIKLIGLSRPVAEEAIKQGRDLHGNVHCW